jgi:uncharacterized repeat protein (TIGR03803 family)
MKINRHSGKITVILAALIVTTLSGGAAHAKDRAYQVLHDFGQGNSDGWLPVGVPAVAKNGDLYGVTVGGGTYESGTIYKLVPPHTQGKAWTEIAVYDFPSKNHEFPTSLVIDKEGILYGAGGGQDTRGFIFRLTPPPLGKHSWRYDLLYTLANSSDGSAIQGNLTMDAEGNLYGATELGGDLSCEQDGCGTVFELKRPTKNRGNWGFNVLYTFTGGPTGVEPFAGVTFNQEGNLYGTTNYGGTFGYGVTYRLTPPAKKGQPWNETVLYSFDPVNNVGSNPEGPVIFDSTGNIYGTAAFGGDPNCQAGNGCGVAYELSPPARKGGDWSYATLYAFQGGSDGIYPTGQIVLDSGGNLYGTTQQGGGETFGMIYRLTPPGARGGAWIETALHRFTGSNGDGAYPEGLTWGKWNDLYGVTSEGGTRCQGCGTAFEIRP